jgi:hypothetical protein
MRKATDIENREFKRRSVEVFIVLLGFLGAMGFLAIVGSAIIRKDLQVWIIVPLIWVMGGCWCLYLWRRFRCPACGKPMKFTARYRCGACETQLDP